MVVLICFIALPRVLLYEHC